MKKTIFLVVLAVFLSGCATYKFHHGKEPYDKGYVVSRDDYTIVEYTIGKDNSVPNLELARERFKKRKNTVEHYYKRMGYIVNNFKSTFWDPPALFLKFIGGVFRLPSIAISDYKYEHNPQYREKIIKMQQGKDAAEEARIQKLKLQLNSYIQKELATEKIRDNLFLFDKMDSLIAKMKNNYLLFILLWMAAVLIFAYAWVPGGLDVDSCNYAVVAKEILRTHKWLGLYDPVYQGVFYYHFPLCIWITALFFKLFGIITFTAKLFSMMSSFVLVGVIFYFGKLLKNHWVGFFAGVSFLLTNHIVRLSRQCRMDLPVSLFITLAILSFILAQKRSRLYYLFFGLFTCLAIFSKDVSGLAPLAIVFIYLVMRWRIKELFHPLFILGLLFAIGPVLFWIWLDHKTLFGPWLNCNFLHLLKSPAFNVPWYYYIWAITTKYFYFLPFAIYGGYLAIKEARNNKKYEFYLLIIWALIFPLAFSFGRQKLHYFILPIYPAVSLLVGMTCERLFKEQIRLKIAVSIKYILIIAGIVMLCFPLNIRSKRFSETVHMAPVIDQILRQLPEYEFILYKQDIAAILFYSQELSRVRYIKDKTSLEEALTAPYAKVRLCYINEQDFLGLNLSVREKCRTILKYKDKIVIVSPQEPQLTVVLPHNGDLIEERFNN